MGSVEADRRLIVNADDFGWSHSVNQAVIRAHRDGILTTASLMVTGAAAAEAMDLAHQNPRLGVGLHLTLVLGRPVLPAAQIPHLVESAHAFHSNPVRAGLTYFFHPAAAAELELEIGAQFNKFRETGLPLDHVNGHLNLHLHPTVFGILARRAADWAIHRVRLTRDRLRLNLRLSGGRYFYRFSHAIIFGCLSRRARPVLARQRITHTSSVFGLLQTGCVNEAYLLNLLPRLPSGDSELYSHPSIDEAREEADALVSPRVRQLVQEAKIRLVRYQDL